MDEALLVDLLAIHVIGRELAKEGASPEVWRRYRVERDSVLAAADAPVAA
jgi:hypothetical protein